MYTAIPTMELVRDSALAKTIGTFIMGAGTALAYTNAAAKAEDIRDKFFDVDEKRMSIPHFTPQKSYLDDMMGELSFEVGASGAFLIELLGIYYSAQKLFEGQTAPGLVYPVAKVVTHGLAWLVDKYSKR